MKPSNQQQWENIVAGFAAMSVSLTFIALFFIHPGAIRMQAIGLSMEPSIQWGEWELVDTDSARSHAPQRGDVIVFVAPPDPQALYEKRVIGLPGDRITINGTQVIVNGVTLSEPYVSSMLQGNPNLVNHETLVVPPNDYFVLGDDRAYSYDSRAWGFVPRQNIIGRVVFILWPLESNWGFLPDESATYNGV